MSPEAMKLMMYGLPLLTVVFTYWLPAALQLSFFISGFLSFGQASLFKMPAFRRYFNMQPLPGVDAPIAASTTPDGKPPSPYKGKMQVRAPLSTAELNSAFQESRKQGLLEKARKQMLDSTKEIRTAAGTMVEKGSNSMKGRSEKNEKKAREEYEKKRQAEIKAEMEELRRERAALRAERKRAQQEE